MRRLVRGWVSALGFYGAAAGGAVALVIASLSGPPDPDAKPQSGATLQGGVVEFAGAALSHIDPGDLDARLVRAADRSRSIVAVRLAAATGSAAIASDAPAARILLDPARSADWAGKGLEITVEAAPITAITAAEVAVGVQRGAGAPIEWRTQPAPQTNSAALTFEFPAGSSPPTAITVTPHEPQRQDFNYGVEVRAVRVRALPLDAPS